MNPNPGVQLANITYPNPYHSTYHNSTPGIHFFLTAAGADYDDDVVVSPSVSASRALSACACNDGACSVGMRTNVCGSGIESSCELDWAS